MSVNWHAEIVEQLDFYWNVSLRPRLEGLTDDEYFWEPAPNCWTVRPSSDGTFSVDWAWPAPDPPPFTTIAWRLAHIAGPVLGVRASNHFGDGSMKIETIAWPGTAADAVALVDRSYAAWKAGVDALDEAGLARPVGPVEGPYSEHPMATLILHINREVMHHGAEVALLRNLYREIHRAR
jgi:DinB superfamily